ncbi:hypothetical protein ABG768_021681 [Culter alburnus]|uniref:VLIG-type G domain-containing protein n=1 Tax=Culter alburnus TaxID=194366 RepID=A0AAW2ART6_CULAL
MNHNLTIVVFGSSAAVQFQYDNILLGEIQEDIGNVEISWTIPLQMKISGHHISVIKMIGLHETTLDLDHQLTDADKMGIDWLRRVFGDRVLQFVLILFTYDSEEESDSIIDDLKKNSALEHLLKECGGRYHICSKDMNKQSEMRDLMKRIERLLIDNEQRRYTSEMYNTAIREREDLQRTRQKQHKRMEESMEYNTETEIHGSIFFKDSILIKGITVKLRAADVLQLTSHSLQSHESCSEEDLIRTFLQKLLMMNYKARYIKTIDMQHDKQQINDDIYLDEGDVDIFREMQSQKNEETNTRDAIHLMDVQMALFYCADSFLKQLMVTKLSQCQYALPLLVPDPFTQKIDWKMKDTNNEIISKIQPVWKAKTTMVSFFRFGSLSLSKSQLMNNLINERHNTFFHRNCTGSSKTRVLMDGVPEEQYQAISTKDADKFTPRVAFCNLHGDAGDHEKQLQILTEMASVNVVILPRLDKNNKSVKRIQELYKDKKPLICLFTEDESKVTETRKGKYKIGLKNRNQSNVSEELVQAINKCLSSSETYSVFRLEDVSKHSEIIVDEDQVNDCRRGKEAAQQMMGLLEKKDLREIKDLFLPRQGKLWHQWCEKNKELHRSQGNEKDMEKQKQDMKKIREQQHVLDIGEFMKLRYFFLKWLGILLDEFTSADLSTLHYKYDEKWSEVLKLKDKNDIPEQQVATNLTEKQTELDRISKELQAATFGLEHILREIGQIYESCKSVNKNKEGLPYNFSSLPLLAANMMISGFPLELMDGDAAHVPVDWITAVLHKLIKLLGEKRVFVLSVLGIQSSGKSTMLNAMFGLQFAVSAGRCTRGAFMQLVRVSDEMKPQINFDYIMVVDTEGLHAQELSGRSTRHQDNELATFVVGLGNLTLINILGENPSELQEILQIVVQAFMRMKNVNLSPSCMFVHQNISEVTAGEKNMEGRRRLQETLDEMTKLAAKDEVCIAECFSDVITFDIRKDVKYFAQLWEGSPPMAPPNPSYCENIQELKTALFNHASKSNGLKLTDLKVRINDLWEALLNERFTEYSKWSWSLRSAMLETENTLYNNTENETINEVSESDLHVKLKVKSEEVEKSMAEFFEKDKDKDILKQWKASFHLKIKDLKDNIVRETMKKLNEILQQRDIRKGIDAQRTCHENTLLEKSKELAIKLKDKANDETVLKQEFEKFWEEGLKSVEKITKESSQIKGIDVLGDMKQLLANIESVPVNAWKESKDIFSVSNYSDYVKIKRKSSSKN